MLPALTASAVVACASPEPASVDGGARLDVGRDASRRDAAAAPDAAREASAPPDLPDVCVEGWCFEQPLPAGPIASVWAASPDEVWISGHNSLATTWVVRIDGETAESRPEYQQARLFGTGPQDVWALRSLSEAPFFQLTHFDGESWTESPPPFRPSTLWPVARASTWALDERGAPDAPAVPYEWDGSRWTAHPLPEVMTGNAGSLQILSIGGFASNAVWLSAQLHTIESSDDAFTYSERPMLWHWNGATWTELRAPALAGDLRVFSESDVWVGMQHWDGRSWLTHRVVAYGPVGDRSDDLWAIGSGFVYHWDGWSWQSSLTVPNGVAAVTARSPHAWAIDGDGLLHFFDGVAWNAMGDRLVPPGSTLVDVEAQAHGSETDVWAVVAGERESYLVARDGAGRWSRVPETTLPWRGLLQLSGSSHDDVWAFGSHALRHDGTAFRDTRLALGEEAEGIPRALVDLCSFRAGRAHASARSLTSGIELFAWNGLAWSSEARLEAGGGGAVRCLEDGSVWVLGDDGIAERRAEGWRATAPLERIYVSQLDAVDPDNVWGATDRGLLRYDGLEWTLDTLGTLVPRDRVATVLAVDARSPSDALLVASAATPGSGPEGFAVLAHHDGTGIDWQMPLPSASPIVAIQMLGAGDAILVDQGLGTYRLTGRALSTLVAPAAPTAGRASIVSATDAWAIGGTEEAFHFDGVSWAPMRIAGIGWTADILALGPNEVWVLGQNGVAHLERASWVIEGLPGAMLDGRARIGGSPAGGLWALDTRLGLFFRRGGAWERIPLSAPEDPPYDTLNAVGDHGALWLFASHVRSSHVLPWVYHWDGSTLQAHVAPSHWSDLRMFEGRVVARGFSLTTADDAVWERVGGRWVASDELDPEVVFAQEPGPAFLDARAPTSRAPGGRWAVTGSVVLRQE